MKKSVLILLLFSLYIFASFDQLTVAPSTWIVKRETDSGKPLFFNKVAVDGYFSLGAVKLFVGLPLAFSLDPENDKQQLGLGDIQVYGGIPLGAFEPRIGLISPGVYSTQSSKAWIGSQDLKLGIGGAYKPHRSKTMGFLFSLESLFYFYVSQKFGLGERGSWEIPSIVKGSYYFSSGAKVHLETLFTVSSILWEWTTPQRAIGITVVPTVSASKKVSSLIELGCKAGMGPGWSKIEGADFLKSSTNISLGVYMDLSI